MTSTQTYSVPDISCEHCVSAITGEVGLVPGVESIDVSIDSKTVTVVGGDKIAVVAAIDEAGYEIAAPQRSAATAEQQLDDGVVRVTKWTFPPGSETGAHVHEYDYVVVPVTNGDLTIESAEGAATANIVLGVAYQRGKGVAHNVANDGDTTIAFVEVELLDR
jgi:copper chaperone CopZ